MNDCLTAATVGLWVGMLSVIFLPRLYRWLHGANK